MSSRLIVKNIPKKISDKRLRDIFSKHGEVTQIKILENRRFAYIGFHTDRAAAAAKRYLHDTYIDTSKIEVLDALAYGDSKLPRPWSKYSSGSSSFKQASGGGSAPAAIGETEHRKREKQLETNAKRAGESDAAERVRRERELLGTLYSLKQGDTADSELDEYWDVMGTGSRGQRTWANDVGRGAVNAKPVAASAAFQKVEGKMYGARGVPMVRSHVKFEDSDEEYQTMDVNNKEEPRASSLNDDTMEAEVSTAAHDDSVSDLDYLRSKMRDDGGGLEDNIDSDDAIPAPASESRVTRKKGGRGDLSKEHDTGGVAKQDMSTVKVSDKPTLRLRGLPFKVTEEEVIQFFHPLQPTMVRLTKDRMNRPSGRGFVDFAPRDIPRAVKFNGMMMRDRYIEVSHDVEGPHEKEVKRPTLPPKPAHKFANKHVDPTLLGETGRIFVRNLSFMCTEEELGALMEPFGPVSEVMIPLDRETKRSKAIGFVTFLMPEHAVAAYQALDGQPFQGRLLHLIPSQEKRDNSGVAEGSENEGYKKKAARKRKAASETAFNWNTLFLRTDAVAGAMATNYGVEKSDILDKEADGSMAVRMALGETHVVAENKRFLEQNGVVLDAFDTRVNKRSNTVILVKNTPYETTSDEIRSLFTKHGDVGRVIFPPSHTMAMVEMLLPQEARTAFKALAYRKFKHVPIYLEWAPDGCLSARVHTEMSEVDVVGVEDKLDEDETSSSNVNDALDRSTLFVKNLSFETREENLRVHFERVVAIRSVRIATKQNLKGGPPLSMGFGFVEFSSKDDATTALKRLQNSKLDGHHLELKFSTHKDDNEQSSERGRAVKVGGTKLLIRNLPFEASKKELRELCQPFGSVKSVRVPKKFDGMHRGFAFVDFLTKKEAKAAFESLSLSTHLYGRRLVIEWAEDDSSLDTLQSKTRASYSNTGSAKRSKIDEDA